MKFYLPLNSTQCICKMTAAIKAHNAGGFVTIEKSDDLMRLSVNKFGRSEMLFMHERRSEGTQFELLDQKISFLHGRYLDQAIGKLRTAVEELGGKLSVD